MSTQTPPDHTAEVLRFLRAARSEYRSERRRSAAFAAYLLVLFGGVWGVPALLAVAKLGRSHRLDRTEPLLQALPLWLPAVLALATLLVVRSAVWRGPVVADSATVSWLLPQPVARGPLLLPRLASTAAVSALLGMVSGGVLGFLVGNLSGAAWLAVTAAGVWAGLGTALVGTGLGVLIVRHEARWERRQRRIFQAGWCGIALLGLLSVIALTHGLPTWTGTTALWLLPWGWAAQPFTAAALGTAPGWPPATLMWACVVVATAVPAVRAVRDIPAEALRLRATVADRMGTSLYSLDLRRARSAMRVRQRRGARPTPWLRPPRLPWLVLPWRDVLCLVREPGRIGWGCAWSALSVAALAFASARTGTTATLSSCAAVWFLYLAAAQFVEPARLESDDMRRSTLLPYRAGTLALWHAVVPGLLLATTTALGLAACAAVGRWTPALTTLPTAVPASVGAALVGAYRGPVPFHLLVGTETAMGSTAPIQTAVWYLRGLLALLALTAPVAVTAASTGTCGPQGTAWLLMTGAASLLWSRRTARRLNA
ncbi:DUF6297 family protein [Streptomyces sp. S6]